MSDLEKILHQNPDELVAIVQSKTRKKIKKNGDRIVFFGAGRLGELALDGMRAAGHEPLAFVDNNPARWGTKFHGVSVFSPQEAVARFAFQSTFVITVYTSAPVWAQLRAFGVEPISFACLAWLFPNNLLPHAGLSLPHKIFQNSQAVRDTAALWSDEESRSEFLEQIRWRTTLKPEILRPHSLTDQLYFAEDLFSLHDREVFVDCGAFDGDSIKEFIFRVHGCFAKIIGLEPDSSNRKKVENYRESLPDEQSIRLEVLPFAVGDKRELLGFHTTGTAASALTSGQNKVQCVPLDQVISVAPTFIKMDIEGAEPKALAGASGILKKHRPILSVCLYHEIEHLWSIPLWLKTLVPDYELFLRRYSDECWEIVCYALPRNRWKTALKNS